MATSPNDQKLLLLNSAKVKPDVSGDGGVREQEKNFAVGALKGVVGAIPVGLAATVDLATNAWSPYREPSYPLSEKVSGFFKDTLMPDPKPGEASGFSFGEVAGGFLNIPGLGYLDRAPTVIRDTSKWLSEFDPRMFLGVRETPVVASLGQVGGDVAQGTTKISGGLLLGTNHIDDWKMRADAAKHAVESGAMTPKQAWDQYQVVNLNHGIEGAPHESARWMTFDDVSLEPKHIPALASGKDVRLFGEGINLPAVRGLDALMHMDEYGALFYDYKLRFEDMDPSELGYHKAHEGLLVLNKKLLNPDGTLKPAGYGTLFHEIQHAIQTYEGWFGTGTNPTRAMARLRTPSEAGGALDAWWQHKQDQLETAYVVYLNKKYGPMGDQYRGRGVSESLIPSFMMGHLYRDPVAVKMERFFVPGYSNVSKGFTLTRRPRVPTRDEAFRVYTNNTGEVWARVAGRTVRMDPATLGSTPPWRLMDRPPKSQYGNDPTKGWLARLARLRQELDAQKKAP